MSPLKDEPAILKYCPVQKSPRQSKLTSARRLEIANAWLLVCFISAITSAVSCTILFAARQTQLPWNNALTICGLVFTMILAFRCLAVYCNRNYLTRLSNALSVAVFVSMYFIDLGLGCYMVALFIMAQPSLCAALVLISSALLITVPVNTAVYGPDNLS